jgi:hypothetical protein
MTDGALFWCIVGGFFAVLFFGIALVVTFRGVGELRDLAGGGALRRKKEP